MKRATRLVVIALLSFLALPSAHAQLPVIDAAHISRTYISYLKQLFEISQRAEQLLFQIQALEKLHEIPFRPEDVVEEILAGELEYLLEPHEASLVQAIFYALQNPPREFDLTFPGYEPYTPGEFSFATQAGEVEIEDPRQWIAYQDQRVLQTMRQALLATRMDFEDIGRTLNHLRTLKEGSRGNVGHQQALEMLLAFSAQAAEQNALARRDAMFRNDLLLASLARDTNRELQESATEKQLLERARLAIEERHGVPVPVHTGVGGRPGMPEWYQGLRR